MKTDRIRLVIADDHKPTLRPHIYLRYNSSAFNAYRGTAWMPKPCQSCPRKELDFGGCRCQALALTGDASATDPACMLSPHHGKIAELAKLNASETQTEFVYRRIS